MEGYTNFLWTLMMAAVIGLGRDPVAWSKGLGVASSLATLLVVFLFSRWWMPGRSPLWAALAPLWLALNSAFAAWSEGGLETALFTLLATASVFRQVVETVDRGRRPWSALLAALAALTRPEGLLLFAVLAAHRLALRREARSCLRWAGLFVAVFGPYWLWRYVYYGYPFPNTYYAKAGVALWGPGWRYVKGFVSDLHLWLALPLLALPWPHAPQGASVRGLVGLTVAVWSIYVASIGGDFMALYRFLVPLLPLLAFAIQEGLAGLTARARTVPQRALALSAAVLVIAVSGVRDAGLTARALEVGSRDGIDSIGWLKQFVGQTTAIGRYLAATYPPGTRIATTASGTIPYYSRLPTLDLLGLSDLYVAHEVAASYGRPGHAKLAPEDYILRWQPDVLLWHPQAEASPLRPSPAQVEYWRARGYSFRSVRVPGLEPPYWTYLEADRLRRGTVP